MYLSVYSSLVQIYTSRITYFMFESEYRKRRIELINGGRDKKIRFRKRVVGKVEFRQPGSG